MEASRPRSPPLPVNRIRDNNVSSLEYARVYACVIPFKLLLIRFLLNIFILLISNDLVSYISLSIKLNSYMLVLY